jgi:hypothetical protein
MFLLPTELSIPEHSLILRTPVGEGIARFGGRAKKSCVVPPLLSRFSGRGQRISNDATTILMDGQTDGTPTIVNFMLLFDGGRQLQVTMLITLRLRMQKTIKEAFDKIYIYIFFYTQPIYSLPLSLFPI